jgi:hypothetical protein
MRIMQGPYHIGPPKGPGDRPTVGPYRVTSLAGRHPPLGALQKAHTGWTLPKAIRRGVGSFLRRDVGLFKWSYLVIQNHVETEIHKILQGREKFVNNVYWGQGKSEG